MDFIEAQARWGDLNRIEAPARSTTEPHQVVIGRIRDVIWAAFVTYRHEETTTTRIISVRRARKQERAQYERQETLEGPHHRRTR